MMLFFIIIHNACCYILLDLLMEYLVEGESITPPK